MSSLQQFSRTLDLPGNGQPWSWDALLNACAIAYWQHRPECGPRCGSVPGYRDHLARRQRTCQPCRTAYAMYIAIRRHRRAHGIPTPPRQLRPCGTHAAHERHKTRGEQPCQLCEQAESDYQASYYQRRQAS